MNPGFWEFNLQASVSVQESALNVPVEAEERGGQGGALTTAASWTIHLLKAIVLYYYISC